MNSKKFNVLWTSFNNTEWPSLLDYSMTKNIDRKSLHAKIDCHISSDLSWFVGHFPEQAVLPGVVQTHWAGQLSCALFPVGDFHQINNLKFKSMILPNTTVTLHLIYKQEKNSVAFRYENSQSESQNDIFTTGSLLFKEVFKNT